MLVRTVDKVFRASYSAGKGSVLVDLRPHGSLAALQLAEGLERVKQGCLHGPARVGAIHWHAVGADALWRTRVRTWRQPHTLVGTERNFQFKLELICTSLMYRESIEQNPDACPRILWTCIHSRHMQARRAVRRP